MKVTLSDGKVIELVEPKEKHQLEYLKMIENARNDNITEEDAINIQNKQISELSGMEIDKVKDLYLIDKSKIIRAITSRYTLINGCSEQLDF